MAETKRLVITAEGLQKLKDELEYKQTTEKLKIAEELKVAISYGDLSENAEYDAAKSNQAALEARIAELKAMIENAEVIDENAVDREVIGFGSIVTFVEDGDDEEETYTIVGTSESDPDRNLISNECPIGMALMGARVNQIVVAQTPAGALRLRVVRIDR